MAQTASSGVTAALANLKLRTKVLAGFVVILVLLGVVGSVSVFGFRNVDRGFIRYQTIAANTVRVVAIDRDMVQLRRTAYIFSDTGDAAVAAQFDTLAAGIRKQIEDLAAALIDPERRAQILSTGKILDEYVAGFGKLREMRTARDKLVADTLNPSGAKAREDVTGIIRSAMADRDMEAAALAGLTQESLMQVRLNANRFIARPDAKLIETIAQWQATFDKSSAELLQRLQNPARRQLMQDTRALMKAYDAAFASVATQSFAIDKQVGETMARLAESIAAAVSRISESQAKSLVEIDVDTHSLMNTTITTTIGLSAGALVFGLVIAWLLGGGIAGPVVNMTSAMGKLAGGDKSVEIPAQGRTDEIGQMAGAVQVFKEKMVEADRLRAEQEEMKRRAEIEKKAAMNTMADDFESSVKGIVQMVASASTELQSTAQSMSATAEETSRQAGAVAAASEQASTNVQTVASAAEELSSSIREISRQVSESARISGQAVADAGRTNDQVKALAEAAQKIGDVVKLINGIAGQTNLLALNATIEAARAGEAGKGFAVVASEVKSLANQTARATEEISAQVTSIQGATAGSVQAIQTITQTIGRINEIAAAIASAVEEQGAATQEIARNVQQAAAGTNEVSSNITGVTKAATDTGAAAGQVLGASGELSTQSEALGAKVDAFIARIRAS